MFGPSGDERPDVLTDAETVVLPVWLHHRPSVEKASLESLATFLKSTTVPAQAGEPAVAEAETGDPPATGPVTGAAPEPEDDAEAAVAPEADAAPEAEVASEADAAPGAGATDVAAPETGAGAGVDADATMVIVTSPATEPDARARAAAGARAEGRAGPAGEVADEAGPRGPAEAGEESGTEGRTGAAIAGKSSPGTQAAAGSGPEPETASGAEGGAAQASVAADAGLRGATGGATGPDGATQPTGPGSEAIIKFGLADLKAALQDTQAQPGPALSRTVRDSTGQDVTVQLSIPQATAAPARGEEAKPAEANKAEASSAKAAEARVVEAIEAIDTLEATTIIGLDARTAQALDTVGAIEAIEAKTAKAMEAIETMASQALDAIDASAAEIAGTVAGEVSGSEITQYLKIRLVTAQPETGQRETGQRETGQPETGQPETGQPETGQRGTMTPGGADGAPTGGAPTGSVVSAMPSPGAEVARTRVIRLDEPPPSVTLATSATETTIALPQPRSQSFVAVTPVAPAPDTATVTPVPQRDGPGGPAALPPARPGPAAEAQAAEAQAEPGAEPAYVTTRRRTRVSRALLLCILCLQAVLSLRLHNTAFEDEALYVYSGHMELEHLLHGAALQGSYAAYFSGSPVLYPLAAGFLNALGGLTAARMFSLVEMLSITALLYSLSRRLFNERIALSAAMLFSVCESAIFLGNFATYDATCMFLLACAAWIVVRTAGFRWPVFLVAAPLAALAVGVKYAGLLFVPTIAVLPALAGWPLRGRRVLLYPPAFGLAVAGLLYGALRLGGSAYSTAISSTTTNRVQGVTPVATLLREAAEWGGVIFVLALIGTAAYVRRVRTEPEELIAPAGGRFRRLCLGVILSGTALLAPAYQAHLHTDISFQKHIGFGLFFAAPMAGLGLARLLGDHFRRPHIAVGVWSVALVLGLVQSSHLYQVWPNSTQFVQAFSRYLKPHARYLVEVPEVPIYYLLGDADAQPGQFTSTFYINYRNSKGVLLTGTVGFTAAVDAGYFNVVAYNNEITGAADAVLAQALSASKDYYLAAEIHITDVFGPGDYFIWVKGHQPTVSGVFNHKVRRYLDLGSKTTELPP